MVMSSSTTTSCAVGKKPPKGSSSVGAAPITKTISRQRRQQKNATLVRAYLGDRRLDTRTQCNKLNRLYDKMWVYYNFFQPVMRLEEKLEVPQADGKTRIKHRYGVAKTPLERLCQTDAVSEAAKDQLKAARNRTNPRQLRKEIYRLLDDLLRPDDQEPGVCTDHQRKEEALAR